MKYRSIKIKERIVFVPDKELKEALKFKVKMLTREKLLPDLQISSSGKKDGLRVFLPRHQQSRFFVVIDFVHAFHQITRNMLAEVFPEILTSRFDICFVTMGGKSVIPIGFPTSSFLFELFLARKFDVRLAYWRERYLGVITRYTDNILVSWKQENPRAFEELRSIFDGVGVRFTPSKPRKWGKRDEPIRFCGATLSRKGSPRISKQRKREIIHAALQKGLFSLKGARDFLDQWERDSTKEIVAGVTSTRLPSLPGR